MSPIVTEQETVYTLYNMEAELFNTKTERKETNGKQPICTLYLYTFMCLTHTKVISLKWAGFVGGAGSANQQN